ncbi:hypothetical protein CH365_12365 [Leptospira neocaledonica]|uniref:Uncharacterized protein n=1 Tax=Leptospira neocaledonica TaxID=2023192 RepID=A0A2M9ZXL1_9LEPT|nr:hypothetical protein CH365_12365 [Leptospira neocaledonica]
MKQRILKQLLLAGLALMIFSNELFANDSQTNMAGFSLYSFLSLAAPVPPPADQLRGYHINFNANDNSESDSDNNIPLRTFQKRTIPLLYADVSFPIYSESAISNTLIYKYSTRCVVWALPLACLSGDGERFVEKAKITDITINYFQFTILYFSYEIVFRGLPDK